MSACPMGHCRLVAKDIIRADCDELCGRCEGLLIIDALNLRETTGDQSRFSANQVAIRVLFGLVDLFTGDNVGSWWSGDQLPHVSVDVRFLLFGFAPFICVS